MGLFDDLKKTLARKAAEQTAKKAKARAKGAMDALAEDFLGAAEGALDRAREEQGRRDALQEEEEAGTWSLHAERMDRKKRAVEELERLKAARETGE